MINHVMHYIQMETSFYNDYYYYYSYMVLHTFALAEIGRRSKRRPNFCCRQELGK